MKSTGISDDPAPAPGRSPGGPAAVLPWPRLAAAWPLLPPGARRAIASSAGHRLHALWVGRDDLRLVPPPLWLAEYTAAGWRAHPPEATRAQAPYPLSTRQLIDILAAWHEAADWAAPRDRLAFLRAFFQGEAADAGMRRHAYAEIAAAARAGAAQRAAILYASHLAQRRRGHTAAGWWHDEHVAPDDLLRAIEDGREADLLKAGPRSRVFGMRLGDRDVIVKEFRPARGAGAVKDLFRPSRARRAWAAAATLRDLDLPTPEPLGYLDVGRGRRADRSYFITEQIPGAQSVREWVRRSYRSLPGDARRAFREQVAASLLALYRRGVYHADTKTLNLLIVPGTDGAARLWWIDLDAARPGRVAGRREILRNLVQLNGSVRNWIPDDERLAFLGDLAREYPWLRDPGLPARLRAWTERRLRKEIRTRCGP